MEHGQLQRLIYFQMFQCIHRVLLRDIHPVLDLPIDHLLGDLGFRDYGIEHDLALHREEGGEYCAARLPLLLEGVHVPGHQALQEGVRVWTPDREDPAGRQVGHPAT
jgi:hypothetical protein